MSLLACCVTFCRGALARAQALIAYYLGNAAILKACAEECGFEVRRRSLFVRRGVSPWGVQRSFFLHILH